MLICPAVSVTSLNFCFGCTDTYRFAKNDGNQAQLFAAEGDLHIWVNFLNAWLDLKSRGGKFHPSESVFILFPFHLDGCFQRALACSRTSITALLQRGMWRKIMLFIPGTGLYNCCSFDLALGSELECEAA